MMKNFFIILVLSFCFSSEAYSACSGKDSKDCIAASNFGLGGDIRVKSKPNLFPERPATDQVAYWTPTPQSLMTTGVGRDALCETNPPSPSCKSKRGILKIYVEGSWFPWGSEPNPALTGPIPSCGPEACQAGGGGRDPMANNSLCFSGDGKRVIKNDMNIPCEQKDGYGVYGLIALENSAGVMSDPNASAEIAKNPTNQDFRTFQLAPLQSDDDGKFFILDFSKACDVTNGNANCSNDLNNKGDNVVLKGKLYFQIKDRHYDDNVGHVDLRIVSGVYRPEGFIERVVTYFDSMMTATTEGLYKNIVRDTRITSAVQALLVFYIALYGLMFMIGLAEAKHQDMITRLIKVALIGVLISDQSWEFFNGYLFALFTDGAKYISDVVLDATLYNNGLNRSPRFILPEDAAALSVYDILVDMLTSSAINNKIMALLFYNGYFWIYVILIYTGIIFIFLGIVRAISLYFTAIMLVAMLLVTAPVFIVMMLFQMTKQMFENWLQQLTAAGMMLIVLSASMSLLIVLVQNQIENLFSYGVCWDVWFNLLSTEFFLTNVYFWCPRSDLEIDKCVTPLNVFAFLFVAVVFEKVMKDIPQLIDALSNAQLQPISRLSEVASNTFTRSVAPAAMSVLNYGRAGAGKLVGGVAGAVDDKFLGIGKTIKADPSLRTLGDKFSKASKVVTKVVTKVGAVAGPDAIDSAMYSQDKRQKMGVTDAAKSIFGNAMQINEARKSNNAAIQQKTNQIIENGNKYDTKNKR
jgi:type IV secretion system protein VirB6